MPDMDGLDLLSRSVARHRVRRPLKPAMYGLQETKGGVVVAPYKDLQAAPISLKLSSDNQSVV